MNTRLRIVTLLVLSLLLQALAPLAFASCSHLGSQPVAAAEVMQGHAHHAMPADESAQAATPAHACCGGDSADEGCAGGDCAMGGCLSVMMPASFPGGAVVMHAAQAVALSASLPSPPITFHFRPPIA